MSEKFSFELEFKVMVEPAATSEDLSENTGTGIARIWRFTPRDSERGERWGNIHYPAFDLATTLHVPLLAYALDKAGLVGEGLLESDVGSSPVWLAPGPSGFWLAARRTHSRTPDDLPFDAPHNSVTIRIEHRGVQDLERAMRGDPRRAEFLALLAHDLEERNARRRTPKFVSASVVGSLTCGMRFRSPFGEMPKSLATGTVPPRGDLGRRLE